MADRRTLFSINFRDYQFSIVKYWEGGMWGKRKLGPGRYAFDFGFLSVLSEYYK